MSQVESLLEALLELKRPLLLALDVDGTISPIVRDPDRAEIPTATMSALALLAKAPELEVAIITGRDLASLSRMEQLEGVWRAVEHGGVIVPPGESPTRHELTTAHREALTQFRQWVDAHATDAFIEYKPQAIAVHVRRIAADDPERADRLLREADELGQRLGLHVRRGRSVREAEAVAHDKGSALREIFERSQSRSVFFVGDDLTDLPAIAFASQHGVGAFVCSDEQPETPDVSATLLDGVDEVASLLIELSRRSAS